jgi:hypothetical protein
MNFNKPSNIKKWEAIISAFMEGRDDDLKMIHRTGSRSRIFSHLVRHVLTCIGLQYQVEPVFNHKTPHFWYVDFALDNGIVLRTHDFYNPDFILDDGSWVEITLSENTAYKKLFVHGHQADFLKVVWIDRDDGMHRRLCQNVKFPNAEVVSIDSYYKELCESDEGKCLVEKIERLRSLQRIIL